MLTRLKTILDSGSRFFGLDLHYFASGSFWLLNIQIVSVISGFFLSLLYARFLPKLIFGQYSYVLAFVAFFGSLALPGMETAVTRAVAQGRKTVLSMATKKTLPWAVASAFPFIIISLFYALKSPSDTTLAKIFLVCFFLTIPLWSLRFYEAYFVGEKKFKQFFVVTTISNILSFVAIIVVIFTKPQTLFLVVIPLLISVTFSFTVNQLISPKKKSSFTATDYKYAKKLNVLRIVTYMGLAADKIIITKLLGFEALAIYSFAQLLPEQLKSLFKNFQVLSLPKLSQTDLSGMDRKFYRQLSHLFLLAFAIVAIYISMAPWIFKLFFPPYHEAIGLTQIYALSLLTAPTLIITTLFEVKSEIPALKWQIYSHYLLRILLIIILTSQFKLLGTVWAVTLSRFFLLFSSLLLMRKFNPFR